MRESYGRLVAYLTATTGDMQAAEDALSDAFVAALRTWPDKGVPERPDAWLMTTAKRKLVDVARHRNVQERTADTVRRAAEEAAERYDRPSALEDRRLELLFVCAHPAINASARSPLMLQTVLGLDAKRIASAFLVSPAAMGQRLVRAKTKIRDAGIGFRLPSEAELPDRLHAVLEAIYAAYGSGWDDAASPTADAKGLSEEAIWLARLVVSRLPEDPEARGLLALLLSCESRRPARFDDSGEFVPLLEQDPRRWDAFLVREAQSHLDFAIQKRDIGPYQLEAAIQAAHARRGPDGEPHWQEIAYLYEGLVQVSPTLGARVSRAAALARAVNPARGLQELDRLATAHPRRIESYQPYWATRADLLASQDKRAEANQAYERAIGLSESPAIRRYLLRKAGPSA